MPFVTKNYTIKKPTKLFLFLMSELNFTHPEAQRSIAKGRIKKDGVVVYNAAAMIDGNIEIIVFEPNTQNLDPIFTTRDFALFDKPEGVPIHPTSRYTSYSLTDEIKHQFGMQANIVHRLDLDTSGVVLISRNKKSEPILKGIFENRNVYKEYLAYVDGIIESSFTIDQPIKYIPTDKIMRKLSIIDASGKPAKTKIEPLNIFYKQNRTLVKAIPYTGRQHQIRVHLFHVKHPIIGDPIYGQSTENLEKYLNKELTIDERITNTHSKRLMLHANRLKFEFKNIEYEIKSKIDFLSQIDNINISSIDHNNAPYV